MKLVISALADVAEALRGEYEEKNGKFFLKMEGENPAVVEANTKLVEFRDKNIELLKEVGELRPLKTKYEGIDPEEARAAVKKVKELGTTGIKDVEDVNNRVRSMVDDAVKPLRDQIASDALLVAAERKRADDYLFRTKVSDAFTKAGGKTNAVDFVVGLAASEFEIKEGQVVAKTGKFSKEKPGDPLGTDEWVKNLSEQHDYVFAPSNGGGARTNTTTTPSTRVRTDQRVVKNPTPQELGALSKEILEGKVRIENDATTT